MWERHVQTCSYRLSTAVPLAQEKTNFEPRDQTCNMGHGIVGKKPENYGKNLYFRAVLIFR